MTAGGLPAHSREAFEFTARGPMSAVAPLFGAERERAWAPGWNPEFVWPLPPADREGMVFRIAHGHEQAVWVNTRFDLANGDVRYAYVIPGVLVTVISIRLEPRGEDTHVSVEYQRTALSDGANDRVLTLARQDASAGPEWERSIHVCLEGHDRRAK